MSPPKKKIARKAERTARKSPAVKKMDTAGPRPRPKQSPDACVSIMTQQKAVRRSAVRCPRSRRANLAQRVGIEAGKVAVASRGEFHQTLDRKRATHHFGAAFHSFYFSHTGFNQSAGQSDRHYNDQLQARQREKAASRPVVSAEGEMRDRDESQGKAALKLKRRRENRLDQEKRTASCQLEVNVKVKVEVKNSPIPITSKKQSHP